MLRKVSLLLFVGLCFVHKLNGDPEKLARLEHLQKTQKIPFLNDKELQELVFSRDADYFTVILFTIRKREQRCPYCGNVFNFYSHFRRYLKGATKPIFAIAVDIDTSMLFKGQYQVSHLPVIGVVVRGEVRPFRPTKPFTFDDLKEWLTVETGARFDIWKLYLKIALTLVVLGLVVKYQAFVVMCLTKYALRREVVAPIVVVFSVIFASGWMFTRMNNTPQSGQEQNGDIIYVSRGTRTEYGAEVGIMSALSEILLFF